MRELYIIEISLGCEPKLQVWPLQRETDKAYICLVRAGLKVFKKGTAGRYYFPHRSEAVAWLRNYFRGDNARAARRVLLTQALLGVNDAVLLAYCRGAEEAQDLVDRLARDSAKV